LTRRERIKPQAVTPADGYMREYAATEQVIGGRNAFTSLWASVVFLGAIGLAGVPTNAQQANSRRFSVPKKTHFPARWPCQSVRVRGSPEMRTSLSGSTGCTCRWRIPRAWFVAGAVNLGKPNEKLLVVMGAGELRGANTSPFWILRWLGNPAICC